MKLVRKRQATHRMNIALPEDCLPELRLAAEALNRSLSNYVVAVILGLAPSLNHENVCKEEARLLKAGWSFQKGGKNVG